MRTDSTTWTEVATGAEARSVGRWLRRAALPRALPWLVILAVVVTAFVAYEKARPWRPSDCDRWGMEFLSKGEIPPGYGYAETAWGTFIMCNDPP
jgi:hypothetical protein